MIAIGMMQTLKIEKTTDFGVYVGDGSESVLLPKKQVPEGAKIGDEIKVFIYRDSEDRLIATTHDPLIQLNEIKPLQVVQKTKIGAFMYWGLEKDLLLPYKEQIGEIEEGNTYLVSLYQDKSGRLCATMKIGSLLDVCEEGNELDTKAFYSGRVYNLNEEIGAFIAVKEQYVGLIHKKEIHQPLKVGEEVQVRVLKIREDGRLDLSFRKSGMEQMEEDEKMLVSRLKENGGFLPLTDKSDKDSINATLNISKRAFKRAVGRLMKAGVLLQKEDGIYLLGEDAIY